MYHLLPATDWRRYAGEYKSENCVRNGRRMYYGLNGLGAKHMEALALGELNPPEFMVTASNQDAFDVDDRQIRIHTTPVRIESIHTMRTAGVIAFEITGDSPQVWLGDSPRSWHKPADVGGLFDMRGRRTVDVMKHRKPTTSIIIAEWVASSGSRDGWVRVWFEEASSAWAAAVGHGTTATVDTTKFPRSADHVMNLEHSPQLGLTNLRTIIIAKGVCSIAMRHYAIEATTIEPSRSDSGLWVSGIAIALAVVLGVLLLLTALRPRMRMPF